MSSHQDPWQEAAAHTGRAVVAVAGLAEAALRLAVARRRPPAVTPVPTAQPDTSVGAHGTEGPAAHRPDGSQRAAPPAASTAAGPNPVATTGPDGAPAPPSAVALSFPAPATAPGAPATTRGRPPPAHPPPHRPARSR